jgi:hypothetical protein
MKERIFSLAAVLVLSQIALGQTSRIGQSISSPGSTNIRIGRSAASYNFSRYSYGLSTGRVNPAVGPLYRDLGSAGQASFDIRRRGVGGGSSMGTSQLVPHAVRRYGPAAPSSSAPVTLPTVPTPNVSGLTGMLGVSSQRPALALGGQPGAGSAQMASLAKGDQAVTSLVPQKGNRDTYLLVEAQKQFRRGDYSKATRSYRRYIGRRSEDPWAYLGTCLAVLHENIDRIEQASDDMGGASTLILGDTTYQFDRAALQLAHAMEFDPALVHVPVDFQALHGSERADRADKVLPGLDQAVLRAGGRAPSVRFLRAYFRFQKDQADQAREDLQAAKTQLESDLSQRKQENDPLLKGIDAFLEQLDTASAN